MAYARFIDKSQVYVIGTVNSLECIACRLTPVGNWFGSFHTNSRTEMLKHLQEHRQHKQHVPWSTTRRLKREIIENGDEY